MTQLKTLAYRIQKPLLLHLHLKCTLKIKLTHNKNEKAAVKKA